MLWLQAFFQTELEEPEIAEFIRSKRIDGGVAFEVRAQKDQWVEFGMTSLQAVKVVAGLKRIKKK